LLADSLRELSAVADRSGWEIWKVYEDAGISGAKGRDRRPGPEAMMKAVNAREFDMVAAWSVDRLGRSLGICSASCKTSTKRAWTCFFTSRGSIPRRPPGRRCSKCWVYFAEFERGIIRERVNAGLARASKGYKTRPAAC
jgi:DNA invertase Pin-like site-specific DNA recombinase